MTDELLPALPEPSFKLKWRDAAYYVSEPNVGDTDVFIADQLRAYAREAIRLAQGEAVCWGVFSLSGFLETYCHSEETAGAMAVQFGKGWTVSPLCRPAPPAGEVA